ncbi:MAG: VOC family protein [Planctomycetota bacterium]
MAIHECFPYLRVRDGKAALQFYVHVFEARERFRLVDPGDGRIGHAEVELGPGLVVMLSDEYPEHGIQAPSGNTGTAIHLHVDDCDALLARAEAAGATITMPASDQFHGERSGKFRDPFGHEWYIGHTLERVTPEEMQRRWNAAQ